MVGNRYTLGKSVTRTQVAENARVGDRYLIQLIVSLLLE